MYLFIIFIIYLEPFTKVFSTTWTSHWISGSSVKTLITGLTLFEIAPWVLSIPVVWHSLCFHSNCNIRRQFLYFRPQMLRLLKFLGTRTLFALSSFQVIKSRRKSWNDHFGQCGHTTKFIYSFRFVLIQPYHTIYQTIIRIPFCYRNFKCLSALNTLGILWKKVLLEISQYSQETHVP